MYISSESETLILKRLESALANEDDELLKIAAYKLHEKFHTGYKFEYKEQFKKVFDFVKTQTCYSEDVIELLLSTIDEILNPSSQEIIKKTEKVSSDILDSIMPSSNNFSANQNYNNNKNIYNEKEYTTTTIQPINAVNAEEVKPQIVNNYKEDTKKDEPDKITIFYEDVSPSITNSQIKNLFLDLEKNNPFYETANEIKECIYALEKNISDLGEVLELISNLDKKTDLVTNSKNGKILEAINNKSNWNFYPIYGSTKLFKCKNCQHEFLDTKDTSNIIHICPKCSNIMIPKIKTTLEPDAQTLLLALGSFSKSNCWILISPKAEDELLFKMLEITLINNKPKFVYILSGNEESKYFYKTFFEEKNIKVRADFLNLESFSSNF